MRVAYVLLTKERTDVEAELRWCEDFEVKIAFVDDASNKERPEFRRMMSFVEQGDIIYLDGFELVANNREELFDFINVARQRGVKLVSLADMVSTIYRANDGIDMFKDKEFWIKRFEERVESLRKEYETE